MRRKIFALIVALVALTIAIGMLGTDSKTAFSAGRLPVRAITVTFESSAHDVFVEQVRKFAEDRRFEIRVRQRTPDPNDTFIQMRSQDAQLLIVRVRNAQSQELRYDIGIYTNGDRPLSMGTVDRLVETLRATVESVPVTSFTITK